jgi:hypothetical protein
MDRLVRRDLYHGLFEWHPLDGASGRLTVLAAAPSSIPDPDTGRTLRISTRQAGSAICPVCAARGEGGFISFANDLRLAYACPQCRKFVWLPGA